MAKFVLAAEPPPPGTIDSTAMWLSEPDMPAWAESKPGRRAAKNTMWGGHFMAFSD
jgi:hypothetical protein